MSFGCRFLLSNCFLFAVCFPESALSCDGFQPTSSKAKLPLAAQQGDVSKKQMKIIKEKKRALKRL